MIGDDSRGRARARARATVHKDAMHGWGQLARAHARARATVHKNTMIEDDARGRHDAQEFQKNQNPEIHDFQKKSKLLDPIRADLSLRSYPRGFPY